MSTDEAYQAVLAELSKLSDAWRVYREVINRAVNSLNHEVLTFQERLDQDDADRLRRQELLDCKLDAIHAGQVEIKRWQWIRVGIEIGAILAVAIVYLWCYA